MALDAAAESRLAELVRAPGFPPLWLFLATSLPHLWYLSIVNCPSAITKLCKTLGPDPVNTFASVALSLNAIQLSSIASFLTSERILTGLADRLISWHAACALPALVLGIILKFAIFRAIGTAGVYYGTCFGYSIPWHTGFPFNVSAHPQYLGSSLVIAASTAVLCRHSDRPGELVLSAWWMLLYAATAIAEEGLIPAGNPSAPLGESESPFGDYTTKPVEGAELMREILMAPVALARFVTFFVVLLFYSAYVLLAGNKFLHPVTRTVGRLLLNSIGMRVRVSGLENIQHARAKAPYIIISNHVSYIDPLALAAALGPYAAVARSDMHKFFIIGRIAQRWGMVPVEYQSRSMGRTEQVVRHAKQQERGTSVPPVLIFPEGTTTNGRCVLSFRRGAFVSQLPVLPVTLSYKTASGFCMGWVERHAIGKHMPRMLTEWFKEVHVTLHPPRELSEDEKQNPDKAARNVSEHFAQKLGMPMRNESTNDAHNYYASLGIEPYASKERKQQVEQQSKS